MYPLRQKASVKRCSSSFSTFKNFERESMTAERRVTAISYGKKEQKAKHVSFERRTKKQFMEDSASTMTIPHEEKFEIYHRESFPEDSLQTGPRDNTSNRGHQETIEDEDIMTQEILREDWDFDPPITNPVIMRESGDGRRSRKDFISDIYSSQEFTSRQGNCCDTPTEESRRTGISSISVSPPRPKKVSRKKSCSEYDLTLADDIANILQHEIPKPVGPLKRCIDGLIPRPKKNNFFGDSVSCRDLALPEDMIDTSVDESSSTSMSSGYGAIPRPKKKDSTRKPNFTDDIMLSRDIDQILDEEVGGFDSTTKLTAKNGAGLRRNKVVEQKPRRVQGGQLAKDVEYIQSKKHLTENTSNGTTTRPQNVNAIKKSKNDDDIKAARNTSMDTIIEEELGEFGPHASGKGSKFLVLPRRLFRGGVNHKEVSSKEKTCLVSKKAYQYNSTQVAQTRPLTGPPADKQDHLDDIMLAKVIEEILEIPVFNSSLPLKLKTKRDFSDDNMYTEKKSKQRGTEAKNNPTSIKKAAAGDGSRCTVGKMPEDCSIEELIADLFPDLLPEVLPTKVTESSDLNLPNISRDSACSVTNGDDLRPMAAGSSKVPFGQLNKGNRACAEKWTTGVFYTDEELKLMAQIERDYSIRKR